MIKLLEGSVFSKYSKDLIHGVTQRNTIDYAPFGFSLSFSEVFSDEEILSNREALKQYIGIDHTKFVFQKQKHSDTISIIDSKSPSMESDGMITNKSLVFLNILIADCCAVLVYDPVNQAIGAFHSGWRGTSLKISSKGIELMNKTYGTNTQDLLVYLSPCAGSKNYEVGYDVAKLFPNHAKPKDDGKFLLGIDEVIEDELITNGVKAENIERAAICTIENSNYHSYRRDKEKSGRMSAFIGITSLTI